MRDGEGEPAIVVPLVVGVVIARVQIPAIVVAVRVEQVRIAVGIARRIAYATTLRILSGLNRIRHRNALMLRAKYLHFLKFLHASPYPKP